MSDEAPPAELLERDLDVVEPYVEQAVAALEQHGMENAADLLRSVTGGKLIDKTREDVTRLAQLTSERERIAAVTALHQTFLEVTELGLDPQGRVLLELADRIQQQGEHQPLTVTRP